jgi:hypothetical protein
MKLALIASVAISVFGCSPFREATNVAQLGADERVVIAKVSIADVDWLAGPPASMNPVFDSRLPVHDGRVFVAIDDGYVPAIASYSAEQVQEQDAGSISVITTPGRRVGPLPNECNYLNHRGGTFCVSVRNQETYLLAMKAHSIGYASIEVLPLLIKLAASHGRCEYIGHLVIRTENGRVRVEIEDDYEENRSKYESLVKGCVLVRSIAALVAPEEIRALEESRKSERRRPEPAPRPPERPM